MHSCTHSITRIHAMRVNSICLPAHMCYVLSVSYVGAHRPPDFPWSSRVPSQRNMSHRCQPQTLLVLHHYVEMYVSWRATHTVVGLSIVCICGMVIFVTAHMRGDFRWESPDMFLHCVPFCVGASSFMHFTVCYQVSLKITATHHAHSYVRHWRFALVDWGKMLDGRHTKRPTEEFNVVLCVHLGWGSLSLLGVRLCLMRNTFVSIFYNFVYSGRVIAWLQAQNPDLDTSVIHNCDDLFPCCAS